MNSSRSARGSQRQPRERRLERRPRRSGASHCGAVARALVGVDRAGLRRRQQAGAIERGMTAQGRPPRMDDRDAVGRAACRRASARHPGIATRPPWPTRGRAAQRPLPTQLGRACPEGLWPPPGVGLSGCSGRTVITAVLLMPLWRSSVSPKLRSTLHEPAVPSSQRPGEPSDPDPGPDDPDDVPPENTSGGLRRGWCGLDRGTCRG